MEGVIEAADPLGRKVSSVVPIYMRWYMTKDESDTRRNGAV